MMIEFWLLASALTLAALALVLIPLLRKSRREETRDGIALHRALYEQRLTELEAERDSGNLDAARFDAARAELERELLNDTAGLKAGDATTGGDRWAALAVLIAVPLITLALYRQYGAIDVVERLQGSGARESAPAAADAGRQPGMEGLPPVEDMVAGLAARMEQNPGDLKGWLLLGRSYIALQRADEAAAALAHAYELQPDDPVVLVRYAEALAMANDNLLSGRPDKLIRRALEQQPDNPDALWLSAMGHAQRGEYPEAIEQLHGLLRTLPENGPDAGVVLEQIAQLQERIDGVPEAIVPPPQSAPATQEAAAAAEGPSIEVSVTLDPALRESLSATDTLFIYARAVSGPRMPLAMARLTAADLPATVTLDDASAMMPAMKLSGFEEVVVMARVSKTGNAMTQSGDLVGSTGPVKVKEVGSVSVVIGERVP